MPETTSPRDPSRLRDPQVAATLDRLHGAARGDWKAFVRLAPRVIRGLARRQPLSQMLSPADMSDVYIPVSRGQGQLLYTLGRAIGAKRIVEFGCSFGISTIYLASVARDTGGQVFSTEIEPRKVAAARKNLADAGLADVAEIREGDALETLRDIEPPIDLLFLDGWKDLYEPLLDLLEPKLRAGSIVFADNVNFPELKPYIARMQSPESPYVSTTLSMHGKAELSTYVGAA